jgi:NADP-dependent 3-hydroxy acid dehydrogenase YdfG
MIWAFQPAWRIGLKSTHLKAGKENTMRFDGKVAIITGGTSGIGLATAELLSAEGAHVVLMARNPIRGGEAVKRITSAGGHAIFVQGDVCLGADCQLCDNRRRDLWAVGHFIQQRGSDLRQSQSDGHL